MAQGGVLRSGVGSWGYHKCCHVLFYARYTSASMRSVFFITTARAQFPEIARMKPSSTQVLHVLLSYHVPRLNFRNTIEFKSTLHSRDIFTRTNSAAASSFRAIRLSDAAHLKRNSILSHDTKAQMRFAASAFLVCEVLNITQFDAADL